MVSDVNQNEPTVTYVNEESDKPPASPANLLNPNSNTQAAPNSVLNDSNLGLDSCECGLRSTAPSPRLSRVGDPNGNGKDVEKKEKNLPTRYAIVFMGFLAFINVYMMYLNLIVAWPVMVDHNATRLSKLDDQKGVFFEKSELNPELTNASTYLDAGRKKRFQDSANLSTFSKEENILDEMEVPLPDNKISAPKKKMKPPHAKHKLGLNFSNPPAKEDVSSTTHQKNKDTEYTLNVHSNIPSFLYSTTKLTPPQDTTKLTTFTSHIDIELKHENKTELFTPMPTIKPSTTEVAIKDSFSPTLSSSPPLYSPSPGEQRKQTEILTLIPTSSPIIKKSSQSSSQEKNKRKNKRRKRESSIPHTSYQNDNISSLSGAVTTNIPPTISIPMINFTKLNSITPIENTTTPYPDTEATYLTNQPEAADLSVTIIINSETKDLSESSLVLETESPLLQTTIEDLVGLSSVTIDATTQLPNLESNTKIDFTTEVPPTMGEENTTELIKIIDSDLFTNENALLRRTSTPIIRGKKQSKLSSDHPNSSSSAEQPYVLNTITSSTSSPINYPLSPPCVGNSTNCSFLDAYDIIDKQGTESRRNNTGLELSTLFKEQINTLTPRDIWYGRKLNNNGIEEQDSEEVSEEDSNESDEKIPRLLFRLSDNFKLINCSKVVKVSNSPLDFDIKCLSSLGIISFSVIGSDSSSSSSSSSEEEEDSEEDDDDDEEDDEEDDDEEDEAGEENDEDEGEEGEDEGEEGEDEGEEGEDEEKREIKEDQENEDEDQFLFSSTFESKRGEKNVEKSFKRMQKKVKNMECIDSSEECEDERGEKNEEELTNKDLESMVNSPKGLIRLDEKIPSHVCFYKKKVDDLSFEGYTQGEFKWEPHTQNQLTSAYYWGFLVSQIPAAKLTGIIGGKLVLLAGILFAGFTTLLTPSLAQQGVYWLLVGRVFLGMMQGMTMPAFHALLAKWAPPLERTMMVAYSYSGIAVGAAIGGPFSAFLVDRIGWQTLFYVQGSLAVLWSIIWFLMIAESPSNHPRISEKEKQFIVSSIGHKYAGRSLPIPWCSIVRSKHVLSLMLAHGAFGWAWHSLLHHAPRYIATVLHVDLSDVQNAWAAALGCMFVVTCAIATLADWARKTRKVSTISVRRAANSLCSLLTAAFLVGVAQAYCNAEAVKVCFALAIAAGVPGALVSLFPNSLDIAPNHAAAIIAITGTFATTANILAPYYWLLTVFGQETLERWRTIWYTSAIFLLLANCLFFLLVGTKEQSWNRPIIPSKPQRRRDDDHIGPLPRRRHYTHGIKSSTYISSERL